LERRRKITYHQKRPKGAVGSNETAPKELLKDLKVVLPPSAYMHASENKIKYL
jgi:hypothetical protein